MRDNRFHIMNYAIVILLTALVFAGCAGTPALSSSSPDENLQKAEAPAWLNSPPAEEGYFYGIGCGLDVSEARQKSIVNIGQQYRTHIYSAIENSLKRGDTSGKAMLESVNHQMTSQKVVGAKIFDQYTDTGGTCWVLSRAPLDCALDTAEGVILSYSLDIKEKAFNTESIIEKLEVNLEQAGKNYEIYLQDESVKIPPMMISVDGNIEDWGTVQPFISDPAGDSSGTVGGTDIEGIYFAHDGSSLYLLYDLADGRPGKSGLFYAVGLRDKNSSWERLLFTQYNGGWSTGIDMQTDKQGHHKMVSQGTLSFRDGHIETKYSLKDLELPPSAQIDVHAWLDPSGQAYDMTGSRQLLIDLEQSYFVYQGRIHGKQVAGLSFSPKVQLTGDSHAPSGLRLFSITNTVMIEDGNDERIDLRFTPESLKVGETYRLSLGSRKSYYFIGSSIIQKIEGYSGNEASGNIYLESYDGNHIIGNFSLISNDNKSIVQGLFNVRLP